MVESFRSRLSENSQSSSVLGARTLIWTAGVAPSPLIESLPLHKERGRIVVDDSMAVPGTKAYGRAATAPPFPIQPASPIRPQHNMRFVKGAGSAATSRPLSEVIGRTSVRSATKCSGSSPRSGASVRVATLLRRAILGLRCVAIVARRVLLMLPRLDRKIRVLLQWVLDICFARDTVQLLTVAECSLWPA